MITRELAKTMTDGQLTGARIDILEVLAIQEPAERKDPGTCPKLGAYCDELYTVSEELARRGNRANRRSMACACGHQDRG